MDRLIEVAIKGNYAITDNRIAGVEGEANATHLRLTFGDDWAEYAKKVLFTDARGLNPVSVVLGLNHLEDISVPNVYLIPIPAEPLARAGEMDFAIQGTKEGAIGKTAKASLTVLKSLSDNNNDPNPPTPSELEQIQQQIDYLQADISASVISSANSALAAEQSAQSAAQSAAEAAASAESIADYESHAELYATIAQTKAAEASQSAANALQSANYAQESSYAAAISEANAAEYEQDALYYSITAADHASAAQTAKDQAIGAKDISVTKASEAAQSASNAAASAATASTKASEATAAKEAIENMTVVATGLPEGSAPTVTKSIVEGIVNLLFGIPQGNKGDKGDTGNGIEGILHINGNHAPGTLDTYRVLFTDGTYFEFQLYNGKDGEGSGNMHTSVYDPSGKNTDIFAYIDNKVKTDVPENAKFTDTVYIHPDTHPASMIEESTQKQFVSATDKENWNAKAGTAVATKSADGLMSASDKSKLDGIATGATKNEILSGNITLSTSGWVSRPVGNYIYTATVSGITSNNIVDATCVKTADNIEQNEAIQGAWDLIDFFESDTNSLKFYASAIPDVNIPVFWKVVR